MLDTSKIKPDTQGATMVGTPFVTCPSKHLPALIKQ